MKSGKIGIFPKGLTHDFRPKMAIFPFFFFGNIDQENVFYDILQRKIAFLGYKNIKFKKSKIDIFPKGLTHGFGPKMAIFQTFFLGKIGKVNVFSDLLQRKNAFSGYKNIKFKSGKIDIFPKGLTRDFGIKMAIFPTFIFSQYRPGKCLLRYSRTRKTPFSAIKTRR